MKKRLLSVILAGSLLVTMLSACGAKETDAGDAGSSEETTNTADDTVEDTAKDTSADVTIGLAMPTAQEELWVMHSDALEAAAKEKGWEVIVQCANGDTDKQISQVENMLTQGIDVLVIASVDPGTTGTVVSAAHDEGVIVLGYDRAYPGDPYDLYLTFDNVEVGRQMAEYAVSIAPEGNYCLLGGDVVNQPATDEIHQGWIEVLQSYVDSGDITIAADQNCKNWASDEGLAHAENALTANNNEMAAILCANDGIAGGAVQALETAGLGGEVVVTGQDSEVAAAQRIVAGTQLMTLYKAPNTLAAATMDAAELYLKGETPKTDGDYEGIPMLTVAPEVVTADNIDEILIDSGYMTKAEVYGK